jgi:hypothetical protein
MNMKRVGLGGLVVTCLCLGLVRGEEKSGPYPGMNDPGQPAPAAVAGAPTLGSAPPMGSAPSAVGEQQSSWLAYPRCQGCCGPVGGDGPIEYEVYMRSGFNFTLGGSAFGSQLKPGWDITGGARTLFFNPEADRAWTADLSISDVSNQATDKRSVFRLFNLTQPTGGAAIPETDVRIRNLNRTYANVSGGREWYLQGSADCARTDRTWRVGVDLGGRYGTEKLNVTNFTHLTDVNAGLFVAVHSDVEIPMGSCIFIGGVRGEYGYTWSDILQRQNNSDVQDINLLATLGVRF